LGLAKEFQVEKLVEIVKDQMEGTLPTMDTSLGGCFSKAIQSPFYSDISFLVKDEELVVAHKVCST
jgi:hypothetical protein